MTRAEKSMPLYSVFSTKLFMVNLAYLFHSKWGTKTVSFKKQIKSLILESVAPHTGLAQLCECIWGMFSYQFARASILQNLTFLYFLIVLPAVHIHSLVHTKGNAQSVTDCWRQCLWVLNSKGYKWWSHCVCLQNCPPSAKPHPCRHSKPGNVLLSFEIPFPLTAFKLFALSQNAFAP